MDDFTHDDILMSFGDHLEELRRRLALGLAGPLILSLAMLLFGDTILGLICLPLVVVLNKLNLPQNLYIMSPAGGMIIYMKVALVTGLVLGMPWLVYQLWQFVSIGLYPNERRFVVLLFPASVILTVIGLLFMYFLMLPVCLYFLLVFSTGIPMPQADDALFSPLIQWFTLILGTEGGFAPATTLPTDPGVPNLMAPLMQIDEYINFVLWLAIAFAISFQLPLVMLMLGFTGIATYAMMARWWRWAIVICCVFAALITPQDPFSMILLAVPLIGLYGLGLAAVKLFVNTDRPTVSNE